MAKIKDALLESNNWWKEEFKIEYHERDIHKEMSRYIPLPQIIEFVENSLININLHKLIK